MSGSDLIVVAPWIVFAVVLLALYVPLLYSRRASRHRRRSGNADRADESSRSSARR
jgi:hypothetical protein